MSRATTSKLYRTFIKGLITEAGFLTYPEDASIDELNTVLHKKGNRSRRLGIDYEENSPGLAIENVDQNVIVSEYFWRTVANRSNINFVVVQIDNILHFFDAGDTSYGEGKKTFTVDLLQYKSPTATNEQVKATNVQMVAGKGLLFVVQEYIDPIVIEYNEETDTISVVRIIIQIRDFDGVNDGLANDQEPTTLSNPHHYNLRNQGWISPGSV